MPLGLPLRTTKETIDVAIWPLVGVAGPAAVDETGVDQARHVRLGREGHVVGLQPALDGTALIAGRAVGGLEADAAAGLGLVEGGDDLVVDDLRRGVRDERERRAALLTARGVVAALRVARATAADADHQGDGQCGEDGESGFHLGEGLLHSWVCPPEWSGTELYKTGRQRCKCPPAAPPAGGSPTARVAPGRTAGATSACSGVTGCADGPRARQLDHPRRPAVPQPAGAGADRRGAGAAGDRARRPGAGHRLRDRRAADPDRRAVRLRRPRRRRRGDPDRRGTPEGAGAGVLRRAGVPRRRRPHGGAHRRSVRPDRLPGLDACRRRHPPRRAGASREPHEARRPRPDRRRLLAPPARPGLPRGPRRERRRAPRTTPACCKRDRTPAWSRCTPPSPARRSGTATSGG